MNSSSRADTLFEQLVEQMEANAAFDVDAFLEQHPEDAVALRERLEKLRKVDFRPGEAVGQESDAIAELLAAQPVGVIPPSFFGADSERYDLIEVIANGGMGTIYRALDRDLNREVAIKTVRLRSTAGGSPSTLTQRLQRFLGEARITGLLEHPNIVPVHDLGVLPNGRLFFAMKLVEGVTWSEHLKQTGHNSTTHSKEERLSNGIGALLKICDALAFAHQHGVVHRDLKPENIMIGRFGEVQVMDWGLVKILEDSDAFTQEQLSENLGEGNHSGGSPFIAKTTTGSVFGTPAFMAPEQARGEADNIGTHTDIFGLGALLFYFVQGRVPYSGDSHSTVLKLAKDATEQPISYSVAKELRAICRKAMAANPEQRYSSVAEFAADLRAFLEDRPGLAWHESWSSRVRKIVRRKPTQTIALAAILVVSLALWAASSTRKAAQAQEQLNNTLIADADKRQRFFAFELADANGFEDQMPPGGSEPRQHDLLRTMVANLHSLDIPLHPQTSKERILLALDQAKDYDPGVGKRAIDVLFSLHDLLKSLHFRSAWEWKHDKLPSYMSDASRAFTQRLYDKAPDLADLWPLVHDVEQQLRSSPWEQLFREQSTSWYRQREVDLAALRSSQEFPHNHSDNLFRLALLSQFVWRRSLTKPEETSPELGELGREMADFAFQRAAELDPSNYWIHESAVIFLDASQHPDSPARALWHSELAVAAKPDSAVALGNLAALLLKLGSNPERAVKLCQRALAIDPEVEAAYANLGEALFRVGDSEASIAAIPILEDGVARFQNNVGLRRNLGRLLFAIKRLEPARKHLETALKLDDSRYDIWADLADAQAHLGLFEDAIASSQKALQGEVSIGAASICIRSYLELGELQKADSFARRLHAEQSDPSWLHIWASTLMHYGRLKHAQKIYAETRTLLPENLDLAWEHGEVLVRLGRMNQAASVLELALEEHVDAWGGRRNPEEWREFLVWPQRCQKLLAASGDDFPSALLAFQKRLELEIAAARELAASE